MISRLRVPRTFGSREGSCSRSCRRRDPRRDALLTDEGKRRARSPQPQSCSRKTLLAGEVESDRVAGPETARGTPVVLRESLDGQAMGREVKMRTQTSGKMRTQTSGMASRAGLRCPCSGVMRSGVTLLAAGLSYIVGPGSWHAAIPYIASARGDPPVTANPSDVHPQVTPGEPSIA
jgi:hypothetical protein